MRAIKITAHLSNGFVASDPWSPSIDNILAYWYLMGKLSPEEFAVGYSDPEELKTVRDLPIGRQVSGDDWWYLCSAPIVEGKTQEWITHFNRRFDIQHAEEHLYQKNQDRVLRLQTGVLKNKRTRLVKYLCKSVSWHLIANEDEVMSLLAKCTHIGAQTSRGFGEVLRWLVSDGDESLAMCYRALPKAFADALGIDGAEIEWGYRPASRKKENRAVCILPVQYSESQVSHTEFLKRTAEMNL